MEYQEILKGIKYITYNSKEVIPDTLFVCKGVTFKKEYLLDAISKGAISYVSEVDYEVGIPCFIVDDVRKTMAYLAKEFYKEAREKIKLIGITGTKGKTSSTYFTRAILDEYMTELGKPKSGIISGIEVYDGILNLESHITTPEAIETYQHLENGMKSKIEYFTMEVSSQALKYNRVLGLTYDIGGFLNLGEDHISPIEHSSFEDYRAAKLKLFDQSICSIINLDDDNSEVFFTRAKSSAITEKIITFSINDDEIADYCAKNIKSTEIGQIFQVGGTTYEIGLKGRFNVSNALFAIAATTYLGVPSETIKKALKKVRVPGRMEFFTNETKTKTVIVDYAHNGLSFESLINSAKEEFPGKKIKMVFGCPGGKAFDRREKLGRLAGRNADFSYLTEDDPAKENILEICREIAGYITDEDGKYIIIEDREAAIKEAIYNMTDEDILLVAGKGQDNSQIRGSEHVEVSSDIELVKKYLA